MTPPFPLLEATWPAASSEVLGGWTIRAGQDGGSRVSAATFDGAGTPDIAQAEAAMRALGQTPLFMIRNGEDALDDVLQDAGYTIADPTVIHRIATAEIAAPPPPVTCFETWPPLAIQAEIWAQGGIGPARLAIMDRAEGTRTTLFGRIREKPAGSAFVAMHGAEAMLHALEILPEFQRAGLGTTMMRTAAHWARTQGASHLSLAVTRANGPANALYSSLGFEPVGHYHYRRSPKSTPGTI